MNNHHRRAANLVRVCILGAVCYLAVYFSIYLWIPLRRPWGDLILNLFDVLAGGLAALVAIQIWHSYRPLEAPYSVWKYLALGLCFWVAGDVIWTVYNLTVIIVPALSLADLFYLLGYSFILTALHRQFRLFYRPSLRRDILVTGGLIAGVLLADLLVTPLVVSTFDFHILGPGDYVSVLYPLVDVTIAVISLFFVGFFGRGAFARPWIGLAVLAVADGLFTWLQLTNQYAYSVLVRNFFSVIADSFYVAGYLILAILLFNYFFLVRYGPSVKGKLSRDFRDRDQAGPVNSGGS